MERERGSRYVQLLSMKISPKPLGTCLELELHLHKDINLKSGWVLSPSTEIVQSLHTTPGQPGLVCPFGNFDTAGITQSRKRLDTGYEDQ